MKILLLMQKNWWKIEEVAEAGTYTGEFLERMLDENITPYAKELVEDIGK